MSKLTTTQLIKYGAALAAALVIVVLLVFVRLLSGAGESGGRQLTVPAPFKTLRESPGHVTHIADAKVKCSECHDLAQHGFEVPALDLCQRCHEGRVSTIHVGSPLAASAVDCQSCHTFTLDRSIQPHNCARCHDQAQGEAKAIVTHATSRCVDCHDPHKSPSLVPRTCESCHEDRKEVHHASKAAGAQLCLDCHGVHDAKEEADKRCRTCHDPRAALTKRAAIPRGATFKGHTQCVTCHEPHTFTAEGAKQCASCHNDTTVLAAGPKAHRGCESCHRTHDPSPDDAAARCQRCHAKVATTHPKDDKAGACLGCHPVHDNTLLTASARACESCHKEAATPNGRASFHSAKTQCSDCHPKHAEATTAKDASKCGKCHASERKEVQQVAKGGHAQCIDCHTTAAHEPKRPPPACASCHKDEHATLTRGHVKCGDCHDSHSGAQPPGVTCVKCHEPQGKGVHTRVKQQCNACHRPHGPKGVAKPPACTTCHAPDKLPGLHRLAEHRTCKSCHSVHEPTVRSNRATCATAKCHPTVEGKPVAKHEPKAVLCSGCHVFGPGKAASR